MKLLGTALIAGSFFYSLPLSAQDGGLTVIFWNIENYFDPFDDPLTADEDFTPQGAKHWTWKKFILKRNGIAKTILSAADSCGGKYPDVVAFAEVENYMVLRQLVRETPLEKLEYGIVHRNSPDKRGIDAALIFNPKTVRILKVDSLRIENLQTRDILYVKMLHLPSDTLHLLVNHWPSKLGGKEASARKREAVASVFNNCVDSILKVNPSSRILSAGDFNDTPDNITPLVSPKLTNLSEGLFRQGRGTIKYQGEWELIDQFFTNDTTLKMSIFAPSFLLEEDKKYTGDKPRRTYLGPRHNGGLSDHLPIICR